MRRDALYLRDILEAVHDLEEFASGLSAGTLAEARMARWAMVQRLTTIGEATARVSEEFRNRHPEIPWARITAFRNILVHAYFGIRWERVWEAAVEEAPALGRQIAHILESEFREDSTGGNP
ncbi:MAG: DUF86 domain-containing protein [Acidobacteria bacterium]|nr:DUF86 domain-containing protein [Acidobacteriota bacterium]